MNKISTFRKSMLMAVLLSIISTSAFAQLGVGTSTPHSSAQLDVTATNKGVLLPRMTSTQMSAITSPATGLMVYCNDCSPAGLQHYNGTAWVAITDLTYQNSNFSNDNLGNHTASQNLDLATFSLVGNGGSSGMTIASDGKVSLSASGGTGINKFSTDGTLTGNSDDVVPTEAAVKAYVDSSGGLILDHATKRNINGGQLNLQSLSDGVENLALGYQALWGIKKGEGNVALGNFAGYITDSANYNTFLGASAGRLNTKGSSNVAIGNSSMFNNITGNGNVAIGNGAGNKNTLGHNNVFIGSGAGSNNGPRHGNTMIGHGAGSLSIGSYSVYLGAGAGQHDTTLVNSRRLFIESSTTLTPLIGGDFSRSKVGINMHVDSLNVLSRATLQVGGNMQLNNGTAVNEFSTDGTMNGNSDDVVPTEKAVKTYVDANSGMFDVGKGNIHGGNGNFILIDTAGAAGAQGNIAIGSAASGRLTTGDWNTVIGRAAGTFLDQGHHNTFIGQAAGYAVEGGENNTSIGSESLRNNVTGGQNVAIGQGAGNKTTANDGVFVGFGAGYNSTGAENIFLGKQAGLNLSSGEGNVIIGTQAGYVGSSAYHTVCIGYKAGYLGAPDSTLFIENSNSTQPLIGGNFADDKVGINVTVSSLDENSATLTVGGDMKLQNGVSVNKFSTDALGNSAVSVPTETAVKAYVDSKVLGSSADNLGDHMATQDIDLGINKLVGNGGSTGLSIASDGKISLASGAGIDEFSTDAGLSGASLTAVPTEYAVKNYIDNQARKILNTSALAYTGSFNNYVINANGTGTDDQTITLPSAVGIIGKVIVIKSSVSNASPPNVIVNTTSSQTIDGATSVTLTQYQAVTVQSDGSNWIIISKLN